MAKNGLLIVLAACGGASSHPAGTWEVSPTPKAERTIDRWTTEDEDTYIRRSCKNVIGPDGMFRCPVLAKAGLQPNQCIEMFSAWRANATSDESRHALRLLLAGLSLADSCELVHVTFSIAARSMQSQAGGRTAQGDAPAGCRRRDDGSYELTSEDALRRRGLGDRLFGDTASSTDEPIHVCGLLGETQWLTRLTCADGSRPWGRDLEKAHAARRGSLMGKTRCDGIPAVIDHYVAPCPEKQYDVYMDMYQCGPNEQFGSRRAL